MKRSTKQIVIAFLIFDAIISLCLVIYFTKRELRLEKAYRVCKDCGLYEPEIDMIIEQVRSSRLTPKETIEVWKQTAEPDAVDLCRDCVEAGVEVVG